MQKNKFLTPQHSEMPISIRNEIRRDIRIRRQKLSIQQQQDAALLLNKQLTVHPKIIQAKKIAMYLANDGELDTSLLIEWCWQQQKEVYLPVIHPFSKGQLLFLKYHKNSEMITNQYGIKEPKLDIRDITVLSDLNIILTPLVAFDKQGNRLGMGGGFYDRTLATWYSNIQSHSQTKLYPIGIAHDCQLTTELPTDSWDIPLPEIITPTKKFSFKLI